MGNNIRISEQELFYTYHEILKKHGVEEEEAKTIAQVFTDNTKAGVITHSISRFPLMIKYLDDGVIKPEAKPKLVSSFMAIEKWDADFGFGIISAMFCMNRAIDLAQKFGLGATVSVHSNHWMRPGYYGFMAAEKGFIGICWTTTKKNMVPWGGTEPQIGNNPIVMAVPRENGHMVLDTSMAQYSWGKINDYAANNKVLPTIGGYDLDGYPTDDPNKIKASGKAIPAGFWKGSSMSIVLEAIAAALGQNATVAQQTGNETAETDMTQIFIAINPRCINENYNDNYLDAIANDLNSCIPKEENGFVRYPGQGAEILTRQSENLGILVPKRAWEVLENMRSDRK